jgi:hypothetical protein
LDVEALTKQNGIRLFGKLKKKFKKKEVKTDLPYPVNCNNTGTLTADKHAHTCPKPRWRFLRAQRAIN